MRYFIVHRDQKNQEKVFHLKTPLVVGRSKPCHILLDMEGVSRKHCEFSLVESKVFLKDLDSTNGTFLNGTRIREAVVRPGDRVVVGSCVLFVLDEKTEVPDAGMPTQLLGETTIETLLDADKADLPDAASLMVAGLHRDAFKALFRLTEIVNSVEVREELLHDSLSVLMDLLNMDLGCVFCSEESEAPSEPALILNRSGLEDYPPSSTVVKKVMEEHVSVIASDTLAGTGLFKSPSIVGSGTACIVCVPFRSIGSIQGAIYLSSLKEQIPPKKETLQFVTALATQIGLALENLIHLERLKRDNQVLRSSMAARWDLIGSSRPMAKIRTHIEKVAATNATVLIVGESGTGKELIARAIHHRSNRQERPLVSINCGAIPESTVESELFGHERGAFTGAEERGIGKFELASEGTLFLDEIGELSPAIQVKLLRALEQHSFYRVGGEKLVQVNVRIIAATNADLEALEKQGDFRSDLLYRLKVFVIKVPPLRDHPEDIPELVEHLLAQLAGEATLRVSYKGMNRLRAYHWPGNVRELRNVLEREIILTEGAELSMENMTPPSLSGGGMVGPGASLKQAEKVHIARVLRSVGWNKKAAAEILGIGRPTLYDKIKQYGIQESD
ncbi:MAG: sigma 54-interacting transcriptional regulator [Planctomycetota bacterium]|jgi:transcriptional regulator with GAF, ATPase, and Fis domain